MSIVSPGFPGGSDGKASACSVGDLGSIPGLGRSPGEGNGNPLQYSCLENSMDGGAWWATVHGVAKSRTWLSDFTLTDFGRWEGVSRGRGHMYTYDWVMLFVWQKPTQYCKAIILEKEMATHSSILAWRIPRTEEPGELQSMGSKRVGHNWWLHFHFQCQPCPGTWEISSLSWKEHVTLSVWLTSHTTKHVHWPTKFQKIPILLLY